MKPVAHATGEEILHELVQNLEQSLEPLRYSVLAPSVFDVYLHSDDLDRLSGILPHLIEEGRRALDERLEALRLEARPSRLRRLIPGQSGPEKEFRSVAGGWYLTFRENTDPEVSPGDVLIESYLTLPPAQELGIGSRTRRISTLRSQGASRLLEHAWTDAPAGPAGPPGSDAAYSSTAPTVKIHDAPSPPIAQGARSVAPEATSPTHEGSRFASDAPTDKVITSESSMRQAQLRYQDAGGIHTFLITQPEITVGRGGTGYWVDLRLDTLPDVSRTHFKIRRDETGQFFIKDVSAFGTSVDGVPIPSSIEDSGARKLDRNREVALKKKARIGLANALVIEFEVLEP